MLQSLTPSNYEHLIRLIHERYDKMSKSYQRIALYLTQNPNDVAVLSVTAIAERCSVHASSVVRFAQALGYDGFKTLQDLFQKRLSTAAPGFEARIKALESELDARMDRSEASFLRDLVVRDIASLQNLLIGNRRLRSREGGDASGKCGGRLPDRAAAVRPRRRAAAIYSDDARQTVRASRSQRRTGDSHGAGDTKNRCVGRHFLPLLCDRGRQHRQRSRQSESAHHRNLGQHAFADREIG